MIKIQNGNLFKSSAQCLVNAVNCEGFMGKGIAYQFKEQFPENNKYYIMVCNKNKFRIGDILFFEENGKIIANFPTKNKWREKSQYSHIESGLKTLKSGIIEQKLQSIAIPPLGCGNGGLDWNIVKQMIEKLLGNLDIQILLYEPTRNYNTPKRDITKVNVSHLILMKLKNSINKDRFSKITLQEATYFFNIFSGNDYFKFGHYTHSIEKISSQIKIFQDSYGVETNMAEKILYDRIVSDSVKETLNKYESAIVKSANFINSIDSTHELEIIATVVEIIKNNPQFTNTEIVDYCFNKWQKHNKNRFTANEINLTINNLVKSKIILPQLIGYTLNEENQLKNAKPIYKNK